MLLISLDLLRSLLLEDGRISYSGHYPIEGAKQRDETNLVCCLSGTDS